MIEIPEAPCPELLLWGLSHKNYARIRAWISSDPHEGDEVAATLERFADRLNETEVPPLNGEREWTCSNLQSVRSIVFKDARRFKDKREHHALMHGILAEYEFLDDEWEDQATVSPPSDSELVEKWDEEEVAAAVIARLLNGEYTKHDTQSGSNSSGRHDYNILLQDARRVALEVTQSADPVSRQHHREVQKRCWQFDTLYCDWSVQVYHRAHVDRLEHDLPDILVRLEDLDIEALEVGLCKSVVPVVQRLRGLDVRDIHRLEKSDGSGKVYVGHDFDGNPVPTPDWFTSVVDTALRTKASKLRQAQADQRHLWVWIDYSLGPPRIPDPLDRLPALPAMAAGTSGEEVDVVWVAIAEGSCTAILKCDGHAWEVVQLPQPVRHLITEAIERSRRWAARQGCCS